MPSHRRKQAAQNTSSGQEESDGSQTSARQLIQSLQTHRVNTLTELCRIERVAATTENEDEARSFQEPMTAAWSYYVSSYQLLSELRGLTPSYPFCGDIITDALARVRSDPNSNRSWNLAWLCLTKIQDDNLIAAYAASEAARPDMWGSEPPEDSDIDQLAQCFEFEWSRALLTMLRHWSIPPTWY